MSENFELPEKNNENEVDNKIDMLSILSKIDQLSEEDRKKFRDRIVPDTLSIFERCSEEDKDMLVFLDSCSDEELIFLMKHDRDSGRAMAIHDVNQHLTVLEGLLDNGRISNLRAKLDLE